jgi:hypothetical protein
MQSFKKFPFKNVRRVPRTLFVVNRRTDGKDEKTVGTVEHIKLSQTITFTSNKVMDFHLSSFLVLYLSSFGARHNVFVLSVRAPVHHKKCTWNASHIFKREFLKTLHPCVFPYGKSISKHCVSPRRRRDIILRMSSNENP